MIERPPRIASEHAASGSAQNGARMRGEPTIGRIDEDLLREDRPRATPARSSRERGVLRTILSILAVTAILVALWSNQDRLRALLPETEVNTLLVEGDAALARGQLTGADSASARYAQVLELDPDNTRAIEGRMRIGERLLAASRAALDAGRTDEARALSLEARTMLGGGDALVALDAAIAATAARSDTLDSLLGRAREAQSAGRLTGSDGALELFRQALAADPGNALAQSGQQAVLDALAVQAHAALRRDEPAEATAAIEQIARVSPGHPGLPELRAALGEAERRSVQRRIDERYRGEGLLVQASAALDANDPVAAERLIAEAGKTGVAAADLAAARTRLAELEERNAIANAAASSAEQQQRADALVAEAEAALAAGNLMDPPGANAYDKFREALGADPRHARATAGLAGLPERARTLFAEAVVQNRLGQARQYLDVVEAVRRDDPDLPRLRRELAVALVAQAERQIGEGQLETAARSIAKARELAPGEPRIADAENRLRLARGS